jgi:hypothetical protein
MTYPAVMLLLSGAFGLSAPRAFSLALRLVAVSMLLAAFALIYVFVSDQVAQDRGAYFAWYRQAIDVLDDPNGRDRFFSWLLTLLPPRLSEAGFGLWFACGFFALLTAFGAMAVRSRRLDPAWLPLVLLTAVCDRLFLDVAVNATRGSIAALLVLIGATARSVGVRLALWLGAFGIHGRLTALCIAVWCLAWLLARRPAALRALVWLGCAAFLVRLATGGTLLTELALLDLFIENAESEGIQRGLTSITVLTPSLAVQTVIALVVPALLVMRGAAAPAEAGAPRVGILQFGLVATAVGMLLYPDLSLAQRLFIVPILCLPFHLRYDTLKVLAAAKVVLVAVALSGQLD